MCLRKTHFFRAQPTYSVLGFEAKDLVKIGRKKHALTKVILRDFRLALLSN